jgi:pyruvate kinase
VKGLQVGVTGVVASMGRTLYGEERLRQAVDAGAAAFRLPLGLLDRDLLADFIAARAAGAPVLLDLPASRPRVGEMAPSLLAPGDRVLLKDTTSADSQTVVPLPGLARVVDHVAPGHRIFFRDGRHQFVVRERRDDNAFIVECLAASGLLETSHGCSFPDSPVAWDPLRVEDHQLFARFAAEGLRPDGVLVSFAVSPAQLETVRDALAGFWPGNDIAVFAKIETSAALDGLPALLEAADGLLLGRGDLGLAVPPEYLPRIQEDTARLCRGHGKPLFVATQILEVFARTGDVYRAELSDIALAVRQRVAGLVLCAETNDSPRPIACIELARRVIDVETRVAP